MCTIHQRVSPDPRRRPNNLARIQRRVNIIPDTRIPSSNTLSLNNINITREPPEIPSSKIVPYLRDSRDRGSTNKGDLIRASSRTRELAPSSIIAACLGSVRTSRGDRTASGQPMLGRRYELNSSCALSHSYWGEEGEGGE